jgi:hypothetical protein
MKRSVLANGSLTGLHDELPNPIPLPIPHASTSLSLNSEKIEAVLRTLAVCLFQDGVLQEIS